MRYLEFKNLWTDDDGMIQVELTASNGNVLGRQDFYAYPDQLKELGIKLADFPSSKEDEVIFEYGVEENYYAYVLLKASVLQNTLQSVLEINFNNRLDPPMAALINFYISVEPTALNRLGKSLIHWSKNQEEVLRAEFST